MSRACPQGLEVNHPRLGQQKGSLGDQVWSSMTTGIRLPPGDNVQSQLNREPHQCLRSNIKHQHGREMRPEVRNNRERLARKPAAGRGGRAGRKKAVTRPISVRERPPSARPGRPQATEHGPGCQGSVWPEPGGRQACVVKGRPSMSTLQLVIQSRLSLEWCAPVPRSASCALSHSVPCSKENHVKRVQIKGLQGHLSIAMRQVRN